MLIPYGTDAPIYHWPIVTGVMILLNVAASVGVLFMVQTMPEGQYVGIYNELILQYGHGLRPWQWITSNFIHGGPVHLLGNMVCLWGFGLVVEGKVGWWRFLAIYLGIGAAQCAFEQTIMLFAGGGGSLGASSIIYGLLAIGMVWAPQNEMSCMLLIIIRPFFFEVTLYTLAIVAALIELGTGLLTGLTVSSSVLHLMGGFLGFAIGTIMLKKGWVDCEGWDVFSVWSGTTLDKRAEEAEDAQKLIAEAEQSRHEQRLAEAAQEPYSFDDDDSLPLSLGVPDSTGIEEVQQGIASGDPARAFAAYQDYAFGVAAEQLPERELLQIITLFQRKKLWSPSIPAMVEYLRSFTEREVPIRLRLAHVLIDVEKRPRQALYVLESLNAGLISEKDQQTLAKLQVKAEKLKRSVSDEPLPEEW